MEGHPTSLMISEKLVDLSVAEITINYLLQWCRYFSPAAPTPLGISMQNTFPFRGEIRSWIQSALLLGKEGSGLKTTEVMLVTLRLRGQRPRGGEQWRGKGGGKDGVEELAGSNPPSINAKGFQELDEL